nr:hypothetical protein CTI12_AA355890 [Tanacetum cinerariifolium]
VKGSVEVVHDFKEVETVFSERPRVDKDELINSIVKVKGLNDNSIDNEEGNDGLNDEVNEKELNAIVPKSFDVSQGDDVSRNSSELSGNESNVEDNTKLDKKEETEEAQVSYFDEVPDTISNHEMFEFSNGSTLSNNKSPRDTNVGDKGNVLTKNGDAKDQKEKSVKSSDAKAGELERANRENELEWMKDEKLREIVFQVRENELMGREPFYLMDAEDKALFFKGLENKVEKVNEELHDLHEYLHSNIENLDYGADGISLYDSPEKIIPRWKGPPPATTMSQESLDDYLDQRKALFAETLGNSDLVKRDPQSSVQSTNEKVENKNLKNSKTVIEGSDGSIKPGKKSGKEFWQHTKKWSRGFIDSYNAEYDPETKAVMKDIGKNLDRWITQDAADVMNKVPEKGKKFIAEKINKLKREMELFGPQAVVSKYSEYGDEEEIDYYWWLDLPFLL